LFFMVLAAVSIPQWQSPKREEIASLAVEKTAAPIAMGLLGAREGAPGYLLQFEIVSVHLLVVLVGAAYLARAKRKASRPFAVTGGP
jgi:NADH:ubiquinone oxidoreductase subunit 6 (subunit J)